MHIALQQGSPLPAPTFLGMLSRHYWRAMRILLTIGMLCAYETKRSEKKKKKGCNTDLVKKTNCSLRACTGVGLNDSHSMTHLISY